MACPSAAVEIADLVKPYGARRAVDGLSLDVARGSVLALLGPNGAGKTTTIEICEGFRRADAGTVRVLGPRPGRDAAALRPRVGVMLQDGVGGYTGATAGELLRLFAAYAAHPLDPARRCSTASGWPTSPAPPVKRLSGGQQQRLSLALALVARPELVFLDEPTAGMDPQARRGTWELVRKLRSDGVTRRAHHPLPGRGRAAGRHRRRHRRRPRGRRGHARPNSPAPAPRARSASGPRPGCALDSLLTALPRGHAAAEERARAATSSPARSTRSCWPR